MRVLLNLASSSSGRLPLKRNRFIRNPFKLVSFGNRFIRDDLEAVSLETASYETHSKTSQFVIETLLEQLRFLVGYVLELTRSSQGCFCVLAKNFLVHREPMSLRIMQSSFGFFNFLVLFNPLNVF